MIQPIKSKSFLSASAPSYPSLLSRIKNVESKLESGVKTGAGKVGAMLSNIFMPKVAHAFSINDISKSLPSSLSAQASTEGTDQDVTHYILNVNDPSRGEVENYVVDYAIPNEFFRQGNQAPSKNEIIGWIKGAETYNIDRPIVQLNSPNRIIHPGMPEYTDVKSSWDAQRYRFGDSPLTNDITTAGEEMPDIIDKIYRNQSWNKYTKEMVEAQGLEKNYIGSPIKPTARLVGQYPAASTTANYFNATGDQYDQENSAFLNSQSGNKKIELKDSTQYKQKRTDFLAEQDVLRQKSVGADTVTRYTGQENYFPVVRGVVTRPGGGFSFIIDQNKNVFGSIPSGYQQLQDLLKDQNNKPAILGLPASVRNSPYVHTGWK